MENLTNYYLLARRAIKNEEYTDAISFYKTVLAYNPNDWEANFYTNYAKIQLTDFNVLDEKLWDFGDVLYTIFSVLAKTPMPEEWKTDNILQCSRYVSVLLPETKDKYIDAQQEAFLNMNYAQSQYCTSQHCFNLLACYRLCYCYCDAIEFYFTDNTIILKDILELRKFLSDQHRQDHKSYFKPNNTEYSKEYLDENIGKLQKLSLKLNG